MPATTKSQHRLPCYPNLVPGLHLTDINQLWVADITYIRLPRQFLYLAAVLDAYSQRVIGWVLEEHIVVRLTLGALQMAVSTCSVKPELVHHFDRGIQYACDRYTEVLRAHGIHISMSRKANPYDNAQAESFIKTFKSEEIDLSEYQSKREAQQCIGRFLEQVYN
ncbi:IS3 family transposase, partial [candidate division KSB1 bacterium]